MKIKLLKPYGMLAKDEIINPGKAVADILIKRKIAKAVIVKKKKGKKCLSGK